MRCDVSPVKVLICSSHFLQHSLSSCFLSCLSLSKSSAAGSGGRQASSGASKTCIHSGKSSRRGDSAAAGGKGPAGSGVSLGHQGGPGRQSASQTFNPAKPALRLRSSRSFSSLRSTSLAAAPFMRSSRSLSRLDRRSPGNYPHVHPM